MIFDQFVALFVPVYETLVVPVYGILSATAIYWVPLVALFIFLELWWRYVQAKYISNIDWTLLEIKLPREINKTPRAMELVFPVFYQLRDGTWLQRWTDGLRRAWFSLELVSIDGHVHFFIRTPRFFKNLVESQFYSQFPEIELHEVDDYTKYVDYGTPNSSWDIFGMEYKLKKEDAYPIKTYVDYQLDKEIKETKQYVDPLVTLIEYLGSLKHGEQVWVQILVQAAQDRFKKEGAWVKKQGWKDTGDELVKKLTKKEAKPVPGQDFISDPQTILLSPGERDVVEAVQRNLAKIGFDCGIRAIYLGKKGEMQAINYNALANMMRVFNGEDRNSFGVNVKRLTDFNYPWQDFQKKRRNHRKKIMFNAYKLRSYFYPPYKRHPFILSSEELATIFHFPGSVLETPTFARIPSKTAEPPSNLPA